MLALHFNNHIGFLPIMPQVDLLYLTPQESRFLLNCDLQPQGKCTLSLPMGIDHSLFTVPVEQDLVVEMLRNRGALFDIA